MARCLQLGMMQTKQRYMMSKQKQRYMNLNTIITYQVYHSQTMARCLATGDDAKKQRYMMSKQKQRYMNLNTMVAFVLTSYIVVFSNDGSMLATGDDTIA